MSALRDTSPGQPPAPRSRPARLTARRRRPSTSERPSPSVLPDEGPLRAELFSVGQLERHARTMVGWHQLEPERGRSGPTTGVDRLLERLADSEKAFAEAYALLTGAVALGRQLTPAAEWFVDNYHLIDDQIRTARRHLPRAYGRELPRLANSRVPGTPRVYELAIELISHAHGRVDGEGLRAYIAAYQTVEPLRLGELWAIPIMLRLALLENLRRVVGSIVAGRRERERATYWAGEMTDVVTADPARLVLVLADMVEQGEALTAAFVAELASRIQGQGATLAFALEWLEQRMDEQGQTLEDVFHIATQNQATDQVSISNSIGSLRFLGATDWRVFVESMSVVEATLRDDPAGVYARLDFATRDRYRHVIEAIARQSASSEEAVALAAVRLARAGDAASADAHVGTYLIGRGRGALERAVAMKVTLGQRLRRAAHRFRGALYAGALSLTTALLVALLVAAVPAGASGAWLALWCAASVLVASQVAVALVHLGATLFIAPDTLPRLDFAAGIPPEHKTAVAVPAMLTDLAEVDELVEGLEVRFLANRDPQLRFVLLTDFRDAPAEHMDGDEALLARARAGIEALNLKHPDAGGARFFLLHRRRRWNPAQGVWMGHERKRGKLEDFNAALRGEDRFPDVVGPLAELQDVKYVIALDADTSLPRDAAHELVGALAHPLNRPVYDAARGRIVRGYGILQPRVEVSLGSTARSYFARLFAGEPGIDPYTRAVSDVYQDVFDEGSFIGKGIYDVDAVNQSLGGRLPENRVLSHDLLEGGYARCALASDVVLVEDFPATFAAEVSRRARWIRGDWQIASWLGRRVPAPGGRARNPLTALSRWKVFDNLRRSVVPAALLALFVVGWAGATSASMAALTTLAGVAALSLPGLLAAAAALMRRPEEQRRLSHARGIARRVARQLGRDAFALATLPYDAWVAVVAILQTLGRMLVTHRRLLSWRTAADAQRAARVGLLGSYANMAFGPLLAVAGALALHAYRPVALAWAAPVLALWLLGPLAAWWASRPLVEPKPRLTTADLAFLRGVARRTWRFFETFVAADDQHLPPDNVQEEPPVGVAHRTSPTNIGLALLSDLAAHDLGYLAAGALVARTTRTLDTMDRMQRHQGHFYNWYDSRTLEPLRPMYISTVDSGNLTGSLLTLASGLDELAASPLPEARLLVGLRDTLTLAADSAAAFPEARSAAARLREALPPETAPALPIATTLADVAHAAAALSEVLARAPSDLSAEARYWADAVVAACRAAEVELAERAQPMLVAQREVELRRLAQRCRELADVDYDILYDPTRRLLSIGYSVADHRLDASFYDLLASEARVASFIAIAHGKLPQEHWFSLGRQLTTTDGRPTLMSWSGSMFEYLMPLLVMPSYSGTLLDETAKAVVARQIAWGREMGLPWGVSESGYNKLDAGKSYQYRAFGVPGLGFKRGLGDDRVVAPYASALALMVAPEPACANLRRLAENGQLGDYGFYEAIDATPARLPAGASQTTIRSYMAHHQGMTFLSLLHLLGERPMQRRFMADPSFRATELLLQERVPRTATVYPHPPEVAPAATGPDDDDNVLRVFTSASTPSPEVHLLSNGSYHVAITNAGAGYSRWRDLAVTRWHEDATRDCWGSFGYLRDVVSGEVWSIAHQPTLVPAARYEAIYTQGRAEFRRLDGDIETHVEIGVSSEDDIELRRVVLTNRGASARTIELTSYAEVVLTTAAADASHPAFSNLFVQTELVREQQAIVVTRRPRSATEVPPWLLHHMVVDGTATGAMSYETSRAAFLGRGRTPADPLAMHQPSLGDSAGAVLDPIVAIRQAIVLQPHETARVHLVTGVSPTRDGAMTLIEKYRDRHAAERVFELSWTHSQVIQRRLEATHGDIHLFERLASRLLYMNADLRGAKALLARNRSGQSSLWAYGISGDLPIALVRIVDFPGLDLVRQMLRAHTYWRLKGLTADLVVWVEDASGYRQALLDEIQILVGTVSDASLLDRPGGIFVRRSDQMSEDDRVLMQTVARVVLSDTGGTLAAQLERRPRTEVVALRSVDGERQPRIAAPFTAPPGAPGPAAMAIARPDLAAFNGLGGFTQDGKEYVITTTPERRTPAPWVNVLANPWFGSVVSESGSAYTWCENAHSYRLTPWSNDAVSDPSGEAVYLRDEDDYHYWSPTPLPCPAPTTYLSRHGFGYSVFETIVGGIETSLTVYVAHDAPVKLLLLRLRNRSSRPRHLSVTACFDLVLGDTRASGLPHVVTELDAKTGAVFARNAYNSDFAQRVALLDCSETQRSVTGDRREILGRNGTAAEPAFLRRPRLSGRVGAALDPCMAMQVMTELAESEEREIAFTFGSGRDLIDARLLVARFRGTGPAHGALERVWAKWNRTLGAVNVQTPDPAVNFMANGWLVYQVLAARMWGRSGFYQSGGAYGFRDQLQDAMALVHTEPAILREQILRAAARQFREGDVQHWWHPPQGRGVRTHISDDYLWLPYALCRYVETIGDTGVLDEKVGFLDGRAVKPDEESYYDLPLRSDEVDTLYEHCVRAIRHGFRFGEHGLPLMGSGDWNDGMNKVGELGHGESVWLGFFLCDVLARFAVLARNRGDTAFAEQCLGHAADLRRNLEAHAWDGDWYRRAYFDDGTPLGSASSPECQIDSLPQSWSVLSGAGEPGRAKVALASLDARLVRRDLGIIQLFDPPFDTSLLRPGYIKGYVPGVRENGGQYTHAAVWAAMAFAAAGQVAKAWELSGMLNPVHHGDSADAIAVYQVEPYVVAADVYTNTQHAGRGGWTWYTGAAGWMYRLVVESLLGIHLEVDRLRIAPIIPAEWKGFDLHYRYRETNYHLHVVRRGQGDLVRRLVLDGAVQTDGHLPLVDDRKEHQVEVEVG